MRRLICLAAFLIVGCDSGPSNEAFRFGFNPPEAVSFTVDLTKARSAKMGERESKDSTWMRTGHEQVAVDTVFELTGITDTLAVYHNGEAITDPVVQLFAAAPITYVIDTSGLALAVRGYQEIFDALDSRLDAETAARVRQVVNPEVLANQELTTWNAKFSKFSGREMVLHRREIDTTFPSMPLEGQIASYRITELIDTLRVDTKLCGKIRIVSSTDPTKLAEYWGHPVDEVVELFALPVDAVSSASLRKAGSSSVSEWVLEFETMLTHYEASEQELFYYELTPSGAPARNEMQETLIKQFTYSTATAEN